jgi:outer membrane lipoprotein-sorting protein
MHNVWDHRWSNAAIMLLVLFGASYALQFTADMWVKLHYEDEATTEKLYVGDAKYRMDQEEDGQQVVVLVDQEAGMTYVLLPKEKIFMEMPSDDLKSMMNDPFQAAKFNETVGEKSKLGTEEVSGYACDVYDVKFDGDVIMKLWVSEKLGFPLKIVIPGDGGRTMELKNIKEGEPAEELFTMPAGFAKVTNLGQRVVEVPDWAADIKTAEIVKPPFERLMSAEEIVRVKIEAGKGIKVDGINNIEGNSAFAAVPFKDGRPIKEPSIFTYNLTWKGANWPTFFKYTPAEADEIVIRVRQGSILVKVGWIALEN